MTLVGKTEYTISIRITHSCMACFFSTQITGEILRLIRGFCFTSKIRGAQGSSLSVMANSRGKHKELLESGNKRSIEVYIFPPPTTRSEKKEKKIKQRQHCFKKFLAPDQSQMDRLKLLNFKGFTDGYAFP